MPVISRHILKIMLGTCVLTAAAQSYAQGTDLKPSELRGKQKESVSILQNRFFLKQYRPEFGLISGTFLNEAYTKTTAYGVRTALFFNEWIGAEFQYVKTNVKDSEDRKALNDRRYRDLKKEEVVTVDPETNPIHGAMDLNAIIAPFYGKLNLLNQYIVYSDLYATLGVSRVDTRQGDKTAPSFGVGQRFYMMESFSLRIDWRMRSFVEERRGKNTRKNAQSIDFGMSYFFL